MKTFSAIVVGVLLILAPRAQDVASTPGQEGVVGPLDGAVQAYLAGFSGRNVAVAAPKSRALEIPADSTCITFMRARAEAAMGAKPAH